MKQNIAAAGTRAAIMSDAMEGLSTSVTIPPHHPRITYADKILMTGSCFTEHISARLERYKYRVMSNPFGILYNPVSMAHAFERIAGLQGYDENELVMHNGLYHSMDHHGSFSSPEVATTLASVNAALQQAHDFLKESAFVLISPGTSVVYRYSPTGRIAGNCHKIPQASFTSFRLTLNECRDACEKIMAVVNNINPNVQILWTVSPVRHIKDGLAENQKSKAVLLLAIDEIIQKHNNAFYFPAYEIMLDQLRDYRFYARDMVHPSEVAIDIIWDAFAGAYLDPHERERHGAIEKIKRAMEHRFLHDNREAIRSFASGQLKAIEQLAAKMPEVNWREERQYFFHFLEQD